jgi:hypothetical protein
LIRFQKQSNPNNGKDTHSTWLEVISILEQPALDGSNSSDMKMIPNTLLMKEERSWIFKVHLILKTEELSCIELIKETTKNSRSSMLRTCHLNQRRVSWTKSSTLLLRDHSISRQEWVQEDISIELAIMLSLRDQMAEIHKCGTSINHPEQLETSIRITPSIFKAMAEATT